MRIAIGRDALDFVAIPYLEQEWGGRARCEFKDSGIAGDKTGRQ